MPSYIDSFRIFELNPPTLPSITYTFGETVGPVSTPAGAALSARNSFASTIQAYGTTTFTDELSLSSPFTASTVGCPGLTLGVSSTGSATIISTSVDGKFNTSTTTPAFLTVTGSSVLFTPSYSSSMVTYYAEDPTPGGVVAGSSVVALAQAKFYAGFRQGQIVVGQPNSRAVPTVMTFESLTVGATTVSLPMISSWSWNAIGGGLEGTSFINVTLTGGQIATAAGGRFSAEAGSTKYWQAASGTDTVFTFDQPISSFGFYSTDLGDVEGSLSLLLLPDDGGAEESVLVKGTPGTNGNAIFFGFHNRSKRYTRVRFVCDAPVDQYGIDNVIAADNLFIQNPVPLKGFGLYLTDPANTSGTVYTATITKTTGVTVTTIPVTAGQPSGGAAFWGFTLNEDASLVSVLLESNNSSDMPGIDDVIFGSLFYS